MMNKENEHSLVPFKGFGPFILNSLLMENLSFLSSNQITHKIENWDMEKYYPPIPWTVITVEDQITLYFALNRLFKIRISGNCAACLINGIHIGMSINEAQSIDQKLEYNEWDEDYQSPLGYWIDCDPSSHLIDSISIFIESAMNEDEFWSYNW